MLAAFLKCVPGDVMPTQSLEIITLKSGRKVAVHTLVQGDSGRTIVFCHAAPGAGNFDPDPKETIKRRINLLALDRPSYGKSKPAKRGEWATVASAADDIAEVLKKKRVQQVGAAGWSAGGRVALALAARHPKLVDRVVVVATPAPDEFVPWIPPEFKQAIQTMRGMSPTAVHKAFTAQMQGLIEHSPEPAGLLSMLGVSPADAEALNYPGATDRLAEMMQAAFEQGSLGMAQDVAGYTLQPWGFEFKNVKAKTLLLYGSDDPEFTNKHGAWYQKNLPDARLEMLPGAGHFVVIPGWKRALSFLAPWK